MVTKPSKKELPLWVQEYLDAPPLTKADLEARKRALAAAKRIRKRLDIRPLKIAEIIRQTRDER